MSQIQPLTVEEILPAGAPPLTEPAPGAAGSAFRSGCGYCSRIRSRAAA